MINLKTLFLILFALSLVAPPAIHAQNNVWNVYNFALSKDSIGLEPMSGATAITFPSSGIRATDTIPFPQGFGFHYGVETFTRFSVSTYGWLKFGRKIRSNNYNSEDTIIVPFSSQINPFDCTYKLTGSAPYRRLIIEWSGNYAAFSQQVRFQLWLHETNGKIEFVHQKLNAVSSTYAYALLCKTKILGERAFASIDVRNAPADPLINYNSTTTNTEAIPTNTRYTFQPDTIKPATPGLQFANVLPGCFTVEVTDNSNNESVFILERTAADTPIVSNRYLSTTIPATGGTYFLNETSAKPDSAYSFRTYTTNGFNISDTVSATIVTPLPMISGIKTIPGDYPTINALLNDAACKYIGNNLTIELQNNYSFASEGGLVRFKPTIVNKFFTGITIRPAASVTSLVLTNTGNHALFAIDSVPNVHIDGRAGGVGNNIQLTISQGSTVHPAVAFMNNANKGGIHYTNIQGQNKNQLVGLVFLGARNPSVFNSTFAHAVSGATIEHCKIGPSSGFTHRALVIESGNDNTIRENEFFRFFKEAIYYKTGGKNSSITSNRLYQPEAVPSVESGYAGNHLGTIVADGILENFRIDSNRIGGNVPAWGIGNWYQSLYQFHGMIMVINATGGIEPPVFIRHNQLGNITTSGSGLSLINVKGSSVIAHNRIGTADSSGSINVSGYVQAIFCNYGKTAKVQNNFLSGIKAGAEGYLLYATRLDSFYVNDNDLGGSDRYHANTFINSAGGIEWGGIKYTVIRNNKVRGLSSSTSSVGGITGEWNYLTDVTQYGVIENNTVHHLDARRTLTGIFARFGTAQPTSISGNTIYALHGRGPSGFTGASHPTEINGIDVNTGVYNFDPASAAMTISNNKIFALEYTTPSYTYVYPVRGINVEGQHFAIYNNSISLGINARGLATDSVEMECRGIDAYLAKRAFVEHNSIYIGGKGKTAIGLYLKNTNYNNGNKDFFVTNNIIQIDRNTPDKYYMIPHGGTTKSIVANNNIWYSNNDPNIHIKQQTWRTSCQCDSSAFVANPQFENPAGDSLTLDMHVQPSSAADSAGTPSVFSIVKDMDGEIRNDYSPTDAGADAFNACSVGNASISISPSQEYIQMCPSGTALLTGTVSGAVTGLQWQKNLNNIPGANSLSYPVTETGIYRLTGITVCGTIASSSVFIIKQQTAPAIFIETLTKPPYCDSSEVELKVNHSHHTLTTLEYRWYKNNVLLPAHTTDHETISGIKYNDQVRVEVINNTSCGTLTATASAGFYDFPFVTHRPKIQVASLKDSLYTFGANDTLKYKINRSQNFPLEVIYTSPVPGPLHTMVGDSMLIFKNIPFSFRFRLATMPTNLPCYYADTTIEKTIYVSNTATPTTFTFTGNGNWSDPANWTNGQMPPSPLPFNGTIVINPSSGVCILDVPFTVGIGGRLTVATGVNFIVQGNLNQYRLKR